VQVLRQLPMVGRTVEDLPPEYREWVIAPHWLMREAIAQYVATPVRAATWRCTTTPARAT
jgi:hypothetical protein